MREWRKKVDNSGFIERCVGLVLRAFYNRWKIIHAARETGKEVVHEGKVRVRKAAIRSTLRGLCAQKTPWTNHGVDEGVTSVHCFLGSVTLNIGKSGLVCSR